jgi:hypothetical protein
VEHQPSHIGHHRAKGVLFQNLTDSLTNRRLLSWPRGWGRIHRLRESYGHPGAELFLELVSLVGITNAAQLWEISPEEVALIRDSLRGCDRIDNG